ncbi:Targeting protein for Xklp2 containing protein [Corchorus olitorius]|uniref:Targeting protein for Xklp2 containing protein n=1 Tax=Corchorus olitorius TaxID=93759 RepID=A0A1R3KSE7_9ROSI|nr:Targeting protein for Xklp2 containing protein [Corchorus olitorius]
MSGSEESAEGERFDDGGMLLCNCKRENGRSVCMRVREGPVVVGRWLPRKWDMTPSKMSWLQVRDLLTLG